MKSLRFVLPILLILALALVLPFSFAAEYLGDADKDGNVTSSDARLVLRCAVGLEEASEQVSHFCDMNGDGVVTTSDARLILRTAVSLEEKVTVSTADPSVPAEQTTAYDQLPDENFNAVDTYEINWEIVRYEDGSALPPIRSMVAARVAESSYGQEFTATQYGYYVRSDGIFTDAAGNAKDVGCVAWDRWNGSGENVRYYYLINYTDGESLGFDNTIFETVLGNEMESLAPALPSARAFRSLDGLELIEGTLNGEVCYDLYLADEEDTVKKTSLVYDQQSGLYLPRVSCVYAADGTLLQEANLLSFSQTPDENLFGVPDVPGTMITASNFLSKADVILAFGEKIGVSLAS